MLWRIKFLGTPPPTSSAPAFFVVKQRSMRAGISANASTVTVPVWEKSQVLETDHGVLYGRAVDRDLVAGGGVKNTGLRIFPDIGKEPGDGDGASGFKSPKDRLHELLEMPEGLVREVDIVDPVDLIVAELDVVAEGGAVEVPAADRLDDVVGQVGPRGHEHVDMPFPDKIGDYPPHSRRHHRARETEEFRCLRIPQHPLADVCRPVQCPAVVGAARPIASTSSLTVIPGLTWIWMTGSSHGFAIQTIPCIANDIGVLG